MICTTVPAVCHHRTMPCWDSLALSCCPPCSYEKAALRFLCSLTKHLCLSPSSLSKGPNPWALWNCLQSISKDLPNGFLKTRLKFFLRGKEPMMEQNTSFHTSMLHVLMVYLTSMSQRIACSANNLTSLKAFVLTVSQLFANASCWPLAAAVCLGKDQLVAHKHCQF